MFVLCLDDMRAKPDSHTRGSRISPSETVIELKKQKRRRKNSLTSGSGLLNSARDLNVSLLPLYVNCNLYTQHFNQLLLTMGNQLFNYQIW